MTQSPPRPICPGRQRPSAGLQTSVPVHAPSGASQRGVHTVLMQMSSGSLQSESIAHGGGGGGGSQRPVPALQKLVGATQIRPSGCPQPGTQSVFSQTVSG